MDLERQHTDFCGAHPGLVEPAHAAAHARSGAPVARHVNEERRREGSAAEPHQIGGWDGHDLGDDRMQRHHLGELEDKCSAGRHAKGGERQVVQAMLLPEFGESVHHASSVSLEIPAAK
eukprot:scaffold2699_cov98-Isochrysis_galbana.AAC.8